jgi:hypothetical protein
VYTTLFRKPEWKIVFGRQKQREDDVIIADF